MTSSISRVDGPRRGILVLDPASVAFLAPEGPLWRCTVPEGAIPAAAIPFFDMGSILVLSSGGGAPFWIDTVTGAPRHVLPGTAPLTQGPFALPASRVAALSHLQRVGPQICPDVAAVTTPGGAALLIAGAKSSVASGAVAEGKGEIQFWHRPGQPGTVPLRPVRAMCVMRMGAHRHTPSLASASGASHERPIPWAPSGPAAALGGVEFALGCGSGHESALFVGGVGWGVEEVGVQRVECGKAPSKMFVVQTRGAPGDLTVSNARQVHTREE